MVPGLTTGDSEHCWWSLLWCAVLIAIQQIIILIDPHKIGNTLMCSQRYNDYTDVIMTTMASQITSLTVVYSTVYSDAHQRKHQSSASLAFVRGIHRDRWIPRTNGQLRGKCFHLMMSSCCDALEPNHQAISINSADYICIVLDQFHTETLEFFRNNIWW